MTHLNIFLFLIILIIVLVGPVRLRSLSGSGVKALGSKNTNTLLSSLYGTPHWWLRSIEDYNVNSTSYETNHELYSHFGGLDNSSNSHLCCTSGGGHYNKRASLPSCIRGII